MEDSFKENKRHGIKVPRSTLLPPYLITNPFYQDYADSIDAVFGPLVDAKIDIISNIRNMWVQNPTTEVNAENHTIIDNNEWSVPERAIVVQQVNLLGMKLQNAGVVSDDAYQTIARFVGTYWFGKGTIAFIEFINYCLGSDLQIVNMWTENYVDFLPEGDPGIGQPIWTGGTWYPTTHVTIEANGGLQGLDIFTLQSFFYEIANYNLVLQAIDASFKMPLDVGVALGGYFVNNIVISNFKNPGAFPPPTQIIAESLPTTYHAMGGIPVDFSTAFLLAQPSAWFLLPDGVSKVPVYGPTAQKITNEGDIGIKLLGNAIPSGQFNLIYGPVTFMPFPTFPSSLQIPVYTTGTSTILDGIGVEARAIGVNRTLLLVNPTGFIELVPGSFTPFW